MKSFLRFLTLLCALNFVSFTIGCTSAETSTAEDEKELTEENDPTMDADSGADDADTAVE